MSPTRVLLHVGTPKTGTSYLQDVLFRNRDHLAARGILYPADRFDAHFLAALDLMRAALGRAREARPSAPGTRWPSGSAASTAPRSSATRSWPPPPAPRSAAPSSRCGHPDTEVHVVLSARDLVRQIPAEWQENVKHRRTLALREFLEQIRDPERAGPAGAPGSGASRRSPTSSTAGAASSTRRPGARGHRAAARRAARRCCGSGSPTPFGLDRRSRSTSRPSGRTRRWACPRPRWSAGSTAAPTRCVEPAHYRPLVRELLAHQTLSRRTGTPAPRAAAGRARAGPTSCRGPGSRSCASAGTTWSATSTSCSRRRRPRRTPTRTTPTSARSPRRRWTRSRRCWSRPRGCARPRPTSGASSTRRTGPWSGPTCDRRTAPARSWSAPPRRRAGAAGRWRYYRRARGRSSRSA